MWIDLAADGNHTAYRTSETKGTRAGGYGGNVENGEVSSARQYTPPLRPNKSSRFRTLTSAAKMKEIGDEDIFANIESQ